MNQKNAQSWQRPRPPKEFHHRLCNFPWLTSSVWASTFQRSNHGWHFCLCVKSIPEKHFQGPFRRVKVSPLNSRGNECAQLCPPPSALISMPNCYIASSRLYVLSINRVRRRSVNISIVLCSYRNNVKSTPSRVQRPARWNSILSIWPTGRLDHKT